MRVRIYGAIEARLQSVDRLVLGGLVEGVWPPETRADPWLSRPMRHAARPRPAGAADRAVGARLRPGARRPRGDPDAGGQIGRRADGGVAVRAAARRGRRRDPLERGARARRAVCGIRPRAGRRRQRPGRCRARSRGRRLRRGRAGSASPRSKTCCAIPTPSTPSMCCSCSRSTPSTRRPARADRGSLIHDSIGEFAQTYRHRDAGRSGRRDEGDRRAAFQATRRFPRGPGVLVAALPAHRRLAGAVRDRAAGAARHGSTPRSAAASPSRSAAEEFKLTVRADRIELLKTAATPCWTTRPARRRPSSRCAPGCRRNSRSKPRCCARAASRASPAGASSRELMYVRLRGGAVGRRGEADQIHRTAHLTTTPTVRWRG